MANPGRLPEEMLAEILLRLSPETLMRLKRVCKSWYAIINGPKFIAKHLVNSLQHRTVPISSYGFLLKRLVVRNTGRNEMIFSFLTYRNTNFRSLMDIDLPCLTDYQSVEFRGHSHGIVCFSDFRSAIILCNLATKKSRVLPPSILLFTEPQQERSGYHSSTGAVGFGYDSRSNDFKVVRVVNFVLNLVYFQPPRVEVYDLSTDRWREINTPVCSSIFWAPTFEMYYKGVYYWWGGNTRGQKVIVSFDMSEEVFRPIWVPEVFEDIREPNKSMGIWKGSLVLFHYPLIGDEKAFDVWVMMKEQSGEISWSNQFSIGPLSGVEKPLLFVNSDELLMEVRDGQAVSYNINTQEVKTLPVRGSPMSFQATVFVKSLLSVKGGQRLDLEDASEII